MNNIINKYRSRLEAAGLLRPAGTNPVSAKIKTLRPSLGKVSAALNERPDRFAIVQPSPLSILFDVILPLIEPILVERGEEIANNTIDKLCRAWVATLEEHGPEQTRKELAELATLIQQHGQDGYLAHEKLDFTDEPADYLSLTIASDHLTLLTTVFGHNIKAMAQLTDRDLYFISKVKTLQQLDLAGCDQVTGAGIMHLAAHPGLRKLVLDHTNIKDPGLAALSGLPQLNQLILDSTNITDAGLSHLLSIPFLTVLNLSSTDISDAGLEILAAMEKLFRLYVKDTSVTAAGLDKLKKARPNLEITNI